MDSIVTSVQSTLFTYTIFNENEINHLVFLNINIVHEFHDDYGQWALCEISSNTLLPSYSRQALLYENHSPSPIKTPYQYQNALLKLFISHHMSFRFLIIKSIQMATQVTFYFQFCFKSHK